MPDGNWTTQGAFRAPPNAIEAEQALLGALLANNKAYHHVSEFLKPTHFVDPVHSRIYEVISRRIDSGNLADLITLKAEFENVEVLDEVGGVAYLAKLVTAMVGVIGAGEYGRSIYKSWQWRSLQDIGRDMAVCGYDEKQDVVEIAAIYASEIDSVTVSHTDHKPTYLSDAMLQAIIAGDQARDGVGLSGVRTGLASLDEAFEDWEPGGVYVVGGRPGDGKSALALGIAIHNALGRVPVAYFSTEMQALQLGRRAISNFTGVASKVIKRGTWTDREKRQIDEGRLDATKVREFFSIEDAPGLNMRFIANRARTFARKFPGKIGLIVVDHMHDLEEMGQEMKAAVGSIMRAAKSMAKQLGWPVLILAQMNRAKDTREDKKPEMSDLYGGMQIEAVAEGIVLLHRPDQALDPLEPERKPGEMDEKYNSRFNEWQDQWNKLRNLTRGYIPKNRDGERGKVCQWRFNGASNRFTEESDKQYV